MHSADDGDMPGPSEARAEQLKHFLIQCSDLAVQLDPQGRVAAVYVAPETPPLQLAGWAGVPMRALLSPESAPKLAPLLQDNAAELGSQARWRHLNLVQDDGAVLPLLVKHFELEGNAGAPLRLLCARDLRPAMQEQQAFQRELLRQEATRAARPETGRPAE